MPLEIEAGRLVDRFGGQAVYGRPMGLSEMRRIALAENVVAAHRAYRAAEAANANMAEWTIANPDKARLFTWALKAYSTCQQP